MIELGASSPCDKVKQEIPPLNKPKKGSTEENLAAQYLQQQGYQIVEQNYYCKGGEIDLIILKKKALHFIEVKARKNSNFGHPAEFITSTKQQRLIKCAQFFLLKNPKYQDYTMQFDLVSLLNLEITWLENIFEDR